LGIGGDQLCKLFGLTLPQFSEISFSNIRIDWKIKLEISKSDMPKFEKLIFKDIFQLALP